MKIPLNGQWDFVADLDPKYHLDTCIYGKPEFARPGVNRRHWLKVPVPGVWQKYGERYDIFEGVCWFARQFEVPDHAAAAPARLRFGGVNYLCRVFLNNVQVGTHEGGFTEFVIDISGKLKPGDNHLAVMVDNRATTIKWPPCLGYFNYGGIHRDVTLEILDHPSLENVRLTAVPEGDDWLLHVTAEVRDMRPGLLARVSIGESFQWEDRIDAEGRLTMRVPQPGTPAWSPEHPHLEPVAVELLDEARAVVDDYRCDFGFRTVSIQDRKILLNGKPLPLRGVCYVYDSPVSGLVMTEEQIAIDVKLMKDLGCNAVRCHYPMDRRFYAACDRAGLLVWIEPPVYCLHPRDDERNTPFADESFVSLAEQMVVEMIAASRNHPSVVIYGIGNECNTGNAEAEPFFRRLSGRVRSEDPTRLVSYAALYGNVGPVADMVDVLGINSYWGWYDKIYGGKGLAPASESAASPGQVRREPIDLKSMRAMLDKVLAGRSELALLLTEFGADSVGGFRSTSRDLWSEDYHADLLGEIFALAGDYPQIVGTFPFCFSDYRDPSKVHNGYWNELNLKGVVDYHRRPKLAAGTLRAIHRAGSEQQSNRR